MTRKAEAAMISGESQPTRAMKTVKASKTKKANKSLSDQTTQPLPRIPMPDWGGKGGTARLRELMDRADADQRRRCCEANEGFEGHARDAATRKEIQHNLDEAIRLMRAIGISNEVGTRLFWSAFDMHDLEEELEGQARLGDDELASLPQLSDDELNGVANILGY